jgi:hypothetical protein
MKTKLFIASLFIALLVNVNSYGKYAWDEQVKKPRTDDPKTVDAPIDNKIYLGLLLGGALLYIGYRRLKKA